MSIINDMQVIPTINCEDIDCVKTKLEQLRKIFAELPSSDGATDENWIQIDVSDGKFTPVVTWNNPEQLSEIGGQVLNFYIEVHLMVQRPEADVKRWLEAGAKRIILHIESEFDFEKVRKLCEKHGAELMLALKLDTPVKKIFPYINGQISNIKLIQLLAVNPGHSGQKFQPQVVEKIRSLLRQYPDATIANEEKDGNKACIFSECRNCNGEAVTIANEEKDGNKACIFSECRNCNGEAITIEVDGGMNPDTAAQVIEAGAKIIAAGSYIFESDNPVAAYRELKNLTSNT